MNPVHRGVVYSPAMKTNRCFRFILLLLVWQIGLGLSACQMVRCLQTPGTDSEKGRTTAPQTPPKINPPVFVITKAQSGSVEIRGKLVITDPLRLVPEKKNPIALVRAAAKVPAPSDLVELDLTSAPQAEVDVSTGNFRFVNIPAGRYILVVQTENQMRFVARYLQGRQVVQVHIVDGVDGEKRIDLGQVTYP
jgi:hypothetical protein